MEPKEETALTKVLREKIGLSKEKAEENRDILCGVSPVPGLACLGFFNAKLAGGPSYDTAALMTLDEEVASEHICQTIIDITGAEKVLLPGGDWILVVGSERIGAARVLQQQFGRFQLTLIQMTWRPQ